MAVEYSVTQWGWGEDSSATLPFLTRVVKLDGVRLKAVVSTLCFHYKMSGRLKKRDSEFCV